jgi:hypothetical protein
LHFISDYATINLTKISAQISGSRSVSFLGYVDPLAEEHRVRAPKVTARELAVQLLPFHEKDISS